MNWNKLKTIEKTLFMLFLVFMLLLGQFVILLSIPKISFPCTFDNKIILTKDAQACESLCIATNRDFYVGGEFSLGHGGCYE